ncbi:MAG: response regulator, partial [Bacteroidota bacterium]
VCEYVKQKEGKKHIKVIFLSAKSKPEDIQKGFDVGADSYMTKPFSTRELMKEVNKLTTENNLQH